jgi:DNA-binding transcriptional MocR family regulator
VQRRAAGGAPPAVAPVDATALIRSMFQVRGGAPSPGMGTLPEAGWTPGCCSARCAAPAAPRRPSAWLRYGDPAGEPGPARQRCRAGWPTSACRPRPQIVTTVGATHGLDIVSRTLLQPGDAVLVDEPGWAVEFARLTRLGMRLLPVPRGADGPDLAVMEALLRAHRPRLYVTVSVLHNPTGASLAPAVAHQLLRLADPMT